MNLTVQTDFPTGNGLVSQTASDAILIDCDVRDSVGDRWYWHVRLASSAIVSIRVQMARRSLLAECGPTISYGAAHGWLNAESTYDDWFDVVVPRGGAVNLFPTFPYGLTEWNAFRSHLPKGARVETLTQSESGRPIAIANIRPNEKARATVLLTARHHSCEAMGSFVLEGAISQFIDLLHRRDPVATTSHLLAVPLVDVDGVYAGDQGKGRGPWDHGRDYGKCSMYAAVNALRTLIESNYQGAVFALDFHTPGLRGAIEQVPYIVASNETDDLQAAREVLQTLNASSDCDETKAELLVMDEAWNSARASAQRSYAAWLRSRPSTRVALIVEYPNAIVHGAPARPDSARAFGAAVLRAVLRMMR